MWMYCDIQIVRRDKIDPAVTTQTISHGAIKKADWTLLYKNSWISKQKTYSNAHRSWDYCSAWPIPKLQRTLELNLQFWHYVSFHLHICGAPYTIVTNTRMQSSMWLILTKQIFWLWRKIASNMINKWIKLTIPRSSALLVSCMYFVGTQHSHSRVLLLES